MKLLWYSDQFTSGKHFFLHWTVIILSVAEVADYSSDWNGTYLCVVYSTFTPFIGCFPHSIKNKQPKASATQLRIRLKRMIPRHFNFFFFTIYPPNNIPPPAPGTVMHPKKLKKIRTNVPSIHLLDTPYRTNRARYMYIWNFKALLNAKPRPFMQINTIQWK